MTNGDIVIAHLRKSCSLRHCPPIRFCKKILGIFFFRDAVDMDIHEEQKKKITKNFEAKDRIRGQCLYAFGGERGTSCEKLVLDKSFCDFTRLTDEMKTKEL